MCWKTLKECKPFRFQGWYHLLLKNDSRFGQILKACSVSNHILCNITLGVTGVNDYLQVKHQILIQYLYYWLIYSHVGAALACCGYHPKLYGLQRKSLVDVYLMTTS